MPAEAWNKKVAKRALPPGTLRKAVRVVVPICAEEDRTAAAGDPSLVMWLGLLNVELEQLVSFPDLPFAEALVGVANDHFSFVTAEAEPGMKGMEAPFAALVRQSSKDVTSSPRGAARPKRRAAPIAAPDLPPGLDPGVAQQALQAGVSRQALKGRVLPSKRKRTT